MISRFFLRRLIMAYAGIALVFIPISVSLAQSSKEADVKSIGLGDAMHLLAQRANSGRAILQRSSSLVEFPVWKNVDEMQLAFVVDNTESMGKDLEGLKSGISGIVETLNRAIEKEEGKTQLKMALVSYADAQSGKEVDFPTGVEFTQLKEFQESLSNLKTVSGEPFFNEQIDAGVFSACEKLQWADIASPKRTARWIVLCGDAPPYPDKTDADESKTKNPGRRHSDEELIAKLKEKSIVVHGLLCGSGFAESNEALANSNEKLSKTYNEQKPFTIAFMKTLSNATKGRFLDLSDPTTIELLTKESKGLRYTSVRALSRQDVADYKKRSQHSDPVATGSIRVAVLPFDQISKSLGDIDKNSAAVLKAVEVAEQLKKVSVDIVSPGEILKQWKEIIEEDALQPKDIAEYLDVDYVIAGKFSEGTESSIQLSLFDKIKSSPIATASLKAPPEDSTNIVQQAVRELWKQTKLASKSLADETHAVYFAKLDKQETRKEFMRPFSADPAARELMAKGFFQLETAVTFAAGDNKSKPYLEAAVQQFGLALRQDSENVLAHLMIASCYHSLSKLDKMTEHLKSAKSLAAKLEANHIHRLETEADYALLVDGDTKVAISAYQKLQDVAVAVDSAACRRAHWMLAGLQLGDWGGSLPDQEAQQITMKESAREHVLAILCNWPESREAKFYWSSIDNKRSGSDDIDIPSDGQKKMFPLEVASNSRD